MLRPPAEIEHWFFSAHVVSVLYVVVHVPHKWLKRHVSMTPGRRKGAGAVAMTLNPCRNSKGRERKKKPQEINMRSRDTLTICIPGVHCNAAGKVFLPHLIHCIISCLPDYCNSVVPSVQYMKQDLPKIIWTFLKATAHVLAEWT